MAQSKSQIRNLSQYKDLTDEEFEEIWSSKFIQTFDNAEEFEERINQKLDEFSQDYDVSDLKINDKSTLRALLQAFIALEDYEQLVYEYRKEVTANSISTIERLGRVMNGLRNDISKLQDDLNIKRKTRQSDEDISVLNYIEDLKHKARDFYRSKMQYVFCEKCNMLLATTWSLYPQVDNKMKFECHRDLGEGKICGHVTTVSTKEMFDTKGSNKPEQMPEGMI